MTKQQQTTLKQNDLLANIDKLILEYTTAKQTILNKNDIIQNIINCCLDLLKNHNDKGGFLRACFVWDKIKGWSGSTVFKNDIVGYINSNGGIIAFNVVKQKLAIDLTDFDFDFTYLEYVKSKQDKVKQTNEQNKQQLLNVKLGLDLNRFNKNELLALIEQTKQQLKVVIAKDKKQNKTK